MTHRAAVVGLMVLMLSGASAIQTLAQLKSLETDDLKLIYIDPIHTYLTPHAARAFQTSLAFHAELFGFEPSEIVSVILADLSDHGGASAGAVPGDRITINMAPLSFAYETMPPGERMTTVMNHEMVHLVSMDQASGSDLFFRKLFGGKVLVTPDHPETIAYAYLTTPRVAVPSWYQEGMAVFMETWMAGGQGRAQGSYDEMVFRSMVKDGSHFYDPLGLVAEGAYVDFQVGINAYLYGTRFMSYLAYEYSPETLIRWVSHSRGSKKYYAAHFEQIFEMPLREAWHDWIEWEQEFQQKNLEAVRRYPITPHRDLSERALGSVSRAHLDSETGRIYAAFNYPGVVAHIGAISVDDGSIERIVDVKAPIIYTVASTAYDPDSKLIYYTTDNSAHRDLRVVDPETGKSRLLMKDARVGDLAFNDADKSIWGIRQSNGITTVVRIEAPYDEWDQIHSWPYGEILYDLDISPDGKRLSFSRAEVTGRHTLRVLDVETLLAGDTTAIAEADFGTSIPSNFVFSDDGKYLYGSSYFTGVSNIFRYEVDADALEAVSNAETGLFRPIPLGHDRLIVFRYTGAGFVPTEIEGTPLEDVSAISFLGAQIAQKHAVVRDWTADSPASIDLDRMITRHDDYQPFGGIRLESIYPVVEGYKDYEAYGFAAYLSDPMFLNRFSVTASYTPDTELDSDERTHLHLDWERRNWKANANWNKADFYDLFGPTETSRKGYSLNLVYDNTLIYDEPRNLDLEIEATYHGDLEALPRFQNIAATFDELYEGSASLSYRNLNASLGAVDYEKGIAAEIIVGASYVDNDLIPGYLGKFDVGFALPLHHSSIWLRSQIGAAFGDQDDPFANFFFGGFGNNYVDHLSTKRYHDYFSFPGLELNEVPGRNFARTMVEWNLPPIRFRRVGSPGFYIPWLRTSLFATGLKTNLDDSAVERELATAGVQIDIRLKIMHKFDMTFSFGYANAFESGLPDRDEYMYSLKILR